MAFVVHAFGVPQPLTPRRRSGTTFEGLSARSLGLRGGEPAGSVDMSTGASAARREGHGSSVVTAGLKDLRDQIATVKNTQKSTDATKLVAAAKVRHAQEVVVNGRPFSENLVKVLFNVNEQLATEDIDIPLTNVRPVKKIALVVITGDRGLCSGFNNYMLKKAEERMKKLRDLKKSLSISYNRQRQAKITGEILEIVDPQCDNLAYSSTIHGSLL